MRVAAGEAGRNGEGACALREGGASAPGRMRSGCVAQLPLKEPPPFCVYTPHPLRYGAGFGRFPHRGAAGGAAPAHQADAGKRVGAHAHTEEFGGGGSDSTTPHPHPPLCSSSLPQEERSRSEHNLVNIQKTHERMQTENKSEGKRGEGDTQGYIASPDPHWGLGAPPRAPPPDRRVSPQSLPITGPSCGGSTPRPRLMRRPSASKLPPRTQIFNLKSPLFP